MRHTVTLYMMHRTVRAERDKRKKIDSILIKIKKMYFIIKAVINYSMLLESE